MVLQQLRIPTITMLVKTPINQLKMMVEVALEGAYLKEVLLVSVLGLEYVSTRQPPLLVFGFIVNGSKSKSNRLWNSMLYSQRVFPRP